MRPALLLFSMWLAASSTQASPVGADPPLPPGLVEEEVAPALPGGLDEGEASEGTVFGERIAPTSLAAPKSSIFEGWHGYVEARGGTRLRSDPTHSKEAVLGEMRLQIETVRRLGPVKLEFTGDAVGDAVLEEGTFDLRRLRANFAPANWIDLRAGRQVLTWGTGDLLFINDLFPKDWVSFLAGRNVEYLKAPSTSIQVGFFADPANLEVVYTPRFEPDRYVTGERLSYWSPSRGRLAGEADPVGVLKPGDAFEDDELAMRAYRNLGGWEAALYGYLGFWKVPSGMTPGGLGTFPGLHVYGASLRGPLGKGIVNLEGGYYDSTDDRDGLDPMVNNSEFRLLAGYEQELLPELTGAVQYYLERITDYDGYRRTSAAGVAPRDENRHVVTLRLTRLLLDQTLTLSVFTYYSPSDEDGHVRPRAEYKWSDRVTLEAGANLFFGESNETFFGQFKKNTSAHAAARYSF